MRLTDDPKALLAHLAQDRGMSWSHVAEIVGVNSATIRRLRSGEQEPTRDQQIALIDLKVFLDFVGYAGIEDPVSWFETPLPFEKSGYHFRPLDLYRAGHDFLLLDLVNERKPLEQVMDEAVPDWREQRSDFEVFTASDGSKAIRLRAKDADEQ